MSPFELLAQHSRKVDLTPFCPIPGNQRTSQSCTGWAVGYGAMTIEKAIKVRQKNRRIITINAYSAAFLYQQLHNGDCQRPMSVQKVLALAQNKGNCLAGQFDRLIKNCRTKPGPGLMQKAMGNRIKKYEKLFFNSTNGLQKINLVKKVLTNTKPVIVSMKVKANFYNIRKGAAYYWPSQGNQHQAGGHAMVVVGYDDDKQAFRLLNSLGTDWGDNGFIWLKYQDFQEMCRQAYILFL